MAYNQKMIFIETSIFTKEIQRLIPDDNYRMLQAALMLRPDAGSLIKGSGGLRKIRWNLPGKGKRGALCHLLLGSSRQYLYALSIQEDRTRRFNTGSA